MHNQEKKKRLYIICMAQFWFRQTQVQNVRNLLIFHLDSQCELTVILLMDQLPDQLKKALGPTPNYFKSTAGFKTNLSRIILFVKSYAKYFFVPQFLLVLPSSCNTINHSGEEKLPSGTKLKFVCKCQMLSQEQPYAGEA